MLTLLFYAAQTIENVPAGQPEVFSVGVSFTFDLVYMIYDLIN